MIKKLKNQKVTTQHTSSDTLRFLAEIIEENEHLYYDNIYLLIKEITDVIGYHYNNYTKDELKTILELIRKRRNLDLDDVDY